MAGRKRLKRRSAAEAQQPNPLVSGKKRKKRDAATKTEPAHVENGAGGGEEAEAEDKDAENEDKHEEVEGPIGGQEEEEEEEADMDEEDNEEEEIIDAEEAEEEAEEEATTQKRVWRPGIDELREGEHLDVEPGSYHMLHQAQVAWPCLSFDIMLDDLGAQRSTYPMTAYVAAGTQAALAADNRIYLMKWSGLHRTSKDGAEESDSDDSESGSNDDREAQLEFKGVPHQGGVNRIRVMPQACHIMATWADTGKVHMWSLLAVRKSLDNKREKAAANVRPIFTCDSHRQEGFAMDFSPHDTGRFISGSNDGTVYLWEPVSGGWNVSVDDAFSGHTSAVEDVQWKRRGDGRNFIFASCGGDRTVRVWDTREGNRKSSAVTVSKAHSADVNVLSWSPCVGELLMTGADDGGFKIWDVRNVAAGPMANFLWHKKPITSVDWHPTDETTLVAASEDDSVSLWDMAVEDDTAGRDAANGLEHYPPQLLFLHMGQKDPKEVRWHPQLSGVCICTAASGFNIFKTCNM